MKWYFYNEQGVVISIFYKTPTIEQLKQPHVTSELTFVDKPGHYKVFKVDIETKVLTVEYVKAPPTKEDRLKQVETDNIAQSQLIDTCLLGFDDMYTMIESILPASQTIAMKGGAKGMVDVYVAMVVRGLKTIEQVPVRYRDQVKDIIAKLEA